MSQTDSNGSNGSARASDPITLRVLNGAFTAAAKEMAHVLYRMSYSSIIRESEDLGAGLYDAEGDEICESDTSPMHVGSLPAYIRGFLKRLDGNINDGDVILHNHPYHGSTHTPDLAVAVPVFWDGRLIGFAAVTAHLLDMGGAAPGLNVDVVDVWAESRLFNGIKLYNAGVKNEDLWQFFLDNVRTPEMNTGDIESMIAACQLGRERFLNLVEKYGVETVLDTAHELMDYSERMLRAEIEKIPDGEYTAPTQYLDDDGRNRDQPLAVCVSVKVEGSDLTIDLTGSSPEVPTGYNVPYEGSTLVASYVIVRSILLDEATFPDAVPQNEGIFRPIKVIAPEGTIFNPRFPRACFSRFNQVQYLADGVNLALAQAVPDKVCAGNAAHVHFLSYSGFQEDKGQYWVYLEVNEGNWGGRHGKDGLDSIACLIENTRNNPVEELDLRFPMRNERYELREEPVAPGKWRGGVGIVRENRFLVPGYLSSEAERHFDPPKGIFEGRDGCQASMIKNPGVEGEQRLYSKVTGYPMQANELLQIKTANSGSYGDPFERDPERVLDDVLDDFITLAMAEKDYGVVIDPTTMQIDAQATARRRAQRS